MTKENGLKKSEEQDITNYINSITTGRDHIYGCRAQYASFITPHNNGDGCWCHESPKINSLEQEYAEFVNQKIIEEITKTTSKRKTAV